MHSEKRDKEKKEEFYVFFHDIFDSFTEYLDLIENIIINKTNITFLFFNIPGQAYSLYNSSKPFNNFLVADALDKLLFHLYKNNHISFHNLNLNLIGLGFGGFLLQSFSKYKYKYQYKYKYKYQYKYQYKYKYIK